MAIGNPVSTTSSSVASKTSSVIATAGQTLFTVSGGYVTNHISVFRNGIRLVDGRDYEARNGATVTLLAAATVGDVLEFHVFDTFSVADAVTNQGGTIFGDLTVEGSIGNITGVAATFTSNVNVGGVLTYEDVTNIDSVGIITARSDLSIADKIIHTGDTNTAIRFPAADTVTVETSGNERLRITSAGILQLDNGNQITAADTTTYLGLGGGNSTSNGANIFLYGASHASNASAFVFRTSTTERLRITSSGDVGIGNNDPGTLLHVSSSNNGAVRIGGNSAGSTGLTITYDNSSFTTTTILQNYRATNGNALLDIDTGTFTVSTGTSGTERFRIDAAGRIGIGLANPSQKVHIQDSSGPLLTFDDATTQFGHVGSYNKLVGSGNIDTFLVSSANSKPLVVRAPSGQTISFDIASNTAMRIDSSGRLGVGTNSPGVKFDVVGSGVVSAFKSTNNQYVTQLQGNNATYKVYLGTTNANDFLIANESNDGTFAERMRIDSSGRLLVGTTTEGNANADDLTVASSGNTGITIRSGTTSTSALYMSDGTSGADEYRGFIFYDHSSNFMQVGTNGSNAMRIDSSGDVGIGNDASFPIFTDDRSLLLGTGSGSVGFQIYSSTTGYGGIYFGDTNSGGDRYRGYVEYKHNDDWLRFAVAGSERMRINSSGNLGINNNNPSQRVHVGGNIELNAYDNTGGGGGYNTSSGLIIGNLYDAGKSYSGSDDRTACIWQERGLDLDFATNNAVRMKLTYEGKLLIGHTSVGSVAGTSPLQVTAATSGAWAAQFRCRSNNDYTFLDFANVSGSEDLAQIGAQRVTASTGRLSFWTNNGGNGSSERMRIDSAGNVGINNTSPGNYASDGRNLVVGSGSGTNGLTIASGQSNSGNIYFADGTSGSSLYTGTITYYHASNYMGFWTDAQERMRLTNNGNLTINGNSVLASGILSFPFYGQTQNGLVIKSTWNGNNASYVVIKNSSDSTIGSITATTTATSFNTSSDYRLKENVVDITDGITRVKQLQPKRFNFIADADTTVDGFIAHEAQTVVPEAVTGTHNGVDENGDPVMQCIDKSKLVPLLTAALKEAIAEIESLKARVTALEG